MSNDSMMSPLSDRKKYTWLVRSLAAVLLLAAIGVVVLASLHRLPFASHHSLSAANTNAQTAATDPHRVLYWYDPMHPTYTSSKPGIAPDCGMELVPKYADEQLQQQAEGTITLNENQQKLAGVRTAVVHAELLARDLHTNAVIASDESRIAHVHVKFSGVIDQVFANATSQFVRKGQTLFTVYSPDLLATEEEFLIARRNREALSGSAYREVAENSNAMLQAARERLSLWDISDTQIHQLEQTGKPLRTLAIASPASGYITDRKAFAHAAVNPDTDLYVISDLSSVWALVDLFDTDLPYVRSGQHVSFSLASSPGKVFTGAISQILPFVDPQTRTVKARVQLANPGLLLKPQMFADASIHISYGKQIALSRDAVLDSGNAQQVYVVEPGGRFVPRKVTLGADLDDRVIVLSGLRDGETVVTSANFLIDSESKLKTAQGARP